MRITVRDSGGEGGASLLTEDTLTVELRAGPPAHLTVEGPATIECGTKATLPQLRVRVCDAAGNPTTSETFEVRGMQTQRRPGLKALARAHTHTHTQRDAMRHCVLICELVLAVQVSVNSSALATDGSGRAAHVTVEGGNKIKVKKGVALLKDVRVTADEVRCSCGIC